MNSKTIIALGALLCIAVHARADWEFVERTNVKSLSDNPPLALLNN